MRPVHCVVPARMGSSRFPGKPLVKLCGREMVLRTLDRAKLAGCFERIVCATDDECIYNLVREAGFDAVMTGVCATGSDRVAEAAEKLGLDLVVNLQGDEPTAELDLLRLVASELRAHPDCWVTASSPLRPEDIHVNTVVKVKTEKGLALDFTRDVSDSEYELNSKNWAEHRGIYAYSKEARDEFSALPRNVREIQESLEQMRVLGRRGIRVVETLNHSASVDVPADVPVLEKLIEQEEVSTYESTGPALHV